MTKAELIEKVAEKAGTTKTLAAQVLDAMTSTIIEAVKADDKVALVGFGTFSLVKRAARTGRNPQTGKTLEIAAKANGKFTPGKLLKDL